MKAKSNTVLAGLTLDQVDAIDMQIARCKALIHSLHDNSEEDEISPFLSRCCSKSWKR